MTSSHEVYPQVWMQKLDTSLYTKYISVTVSQGQPWGISEVYRAGMQGTIPSLVLSFGLPWSSSACSSQTSSVTFLLFQLSFWLIRKAYQMFVYETMTRTRYTYTSELKWIQVNSSCAQTTFKQSCSIALCLSWFVRDCCLTEHG